MLFWVQRAEASLMLFKYHYWHSNQVRFKEIKKKNQENKA